MSLKGVKMRAENLRILKILSLNASFLRSQFPNLPLWTPFIKSTSYTTPRKKRRKKVIRFSCPPPPLPPGIYNAWVYTVILWPLHAQRWKLFYYNLRQLSTRYPRLTATQPGLVRLTARRIGRTCNLRVCDTLILQTKSFVTFGF